MNHFFNSIFSLIFGFYSREAVTSALVNQPPGVFLVRLSERNPGSFAICYTIDDADPQTRVRHYLIKPEDVPIPKKTLADFLFDYSQLSRFMQLHYDLQGGKWGFKLIEKEIALEPFGVGTKKTVVENASPTGYDSQLVRANNSSQAHPVAQVNPGNHLHQNGIHNQNSSSSNNNNINNALMSPNSNWTPSTPFSNMGTPFSSHNHNSNSNNNNGNGNMSQFFGELNGSGNQISVENGNNGKTEI
jgi:hypothetical protein